MLSNKSSMIFAIMSGVLICLCTWVSPANSEPFNGPHLILESKAGQGDAEFGADYYREGGGWHWPTDFGVGPDGSIWVLDSNNRRVQKFDRKGQFQLSKSLDGFYQHLEILPSGRVVLIRAIGAEKDAGMILDRDGEIAKTFDLPGPQGADFTVNRSGEILYPVAGHLTILNENGEIQRVVPNVGKAARASSAFGSANFASIVGEDGFQRYSADATKEEIVRFDPQAFDGTNAKAVQTFSYGHDKALVLWLVSRTPRVEKITLHDDSGNFLGIIPDCAKNSFPDGSGGENFYTIDPVGNFYQMEIVPPGDVIPITREGKATAKAGVPFVRIWKWGKDKGTR